MLPQCIDFLFIFPKLLLFLFLLFDMSVDCVPPMRSIKSNQLNMAATHTELHLMLFVVMLLVLTSCLKRVNEQH